MTMPFSIPGRLTVSLSTPWMLVLPRKQKYHKPLGPRWKLPRSSIVYISCLAWRQKRGRIGKGICNWVLGEEWIKSLGDIGPGREKTCWELSHRVFKNPRTVCLKGSRYVPGGPSEQWYSGLTLHRAWVQRKRNINVELIELLEDGLLGLWGLWIHCKMSLIGSCTKCWGLQMVVLCWKVVETSWDGPSLREVIRSWFPSLSSSFAYFLLWTEYLALSSICCHHVMFCLSMGPESKRWRLWFETSEIVSWNQSLISLHCFYQVFAHRNMT